MKKSFKNHSDTWLIFLGNVICVLISAVLFYLASPNYFTAKGFPMLAWVFAVPLFFVLDGKNVYQRLLFGMMFSLTAYALILSWVINVKIFLFFFFTCFFALQPMIFSVLFSLDRQPLGNCSHHIRNIFFLSALWVCTEAIRAFLIGGYAWTIGHSQAFQPVLIQIADIAGAYGVSFVILVVNGCFYFLIKDRQNALMYLLIALGVFAGVVLYGRAVMREETGQVRYSVCTIQPNISSEKKADPDLIEPLLDQQLLLTEKCFVDQTPDLVVWPETAVTDDILNNSRLNQKIRAFIRRHQVKMLIGSALLIDGKSYNSAVLLGPSGEAEGVYHKQHLLPFHEYFPFQHRLLFLKTMFNLENYEFQKSMGKGILPFDQGTGSGVFGVAICSEEGYPALLRSAVRRQAQWILVMLNDSWFESDAAVMMHAQNGFMQAAAFKVPVIRSTNSGLSCLIDKYGRARNMMSGDWKLNQPAVFFFDIERSLAHTLYARYGDFFIFLCVLFLAMILWNRYANRIYIKKGEKMLTCKVLCLIMAGLFLAGRDVLAGGAVARQQMQQNPQQEMAQKLEAQKTTHEQLLQKQAEEGGGDGVLDFQELWERLAVSSDIWMHLVDREIKALIVETYIDWYRDQGIVIRKPQIDYMLLLDSIALQNPSLFDAPFQNVLMVAAVMEYDFDNGMNKDQLAFKILGPQLYEMNKNRLTGQ